MSSVFITELHSFEQSRPEKRAKTEMQFSDLYEEVAKTDLKQKHLDLIVNEEADLRYFRLSRAFTRRCHAMKLPKPKSEDLQRFCEFYERYIDTYLDSLVCVVYMRCTICYTNYRRNAAMLMMVMMKLNMTKKILIVCWLNDNTVEKVCFVPLQTICMWAMTVGWIPVMKSSRKQNWLKLQNNVMPMH